MRKDSQTAMSWLRSPQVLDMMNRDFRGSPQEKAQL